MARFFKAVLEEVKGNVLDLVYPKLAGTPNQMTLEERLGNGCCVECGADSWILLPKESATVRESGKQYIECMGCGGTTHL